MLTEANVATVGFREGLGRSVTRERPESDRVKSASSRRSRDAESPCYSDAAITLSHQESLAMRSANYLSTLRAEVNIAATEIAL